MPSACVSVLLAVHVSLFRRLSSSIADFFEGKHKKEFEKYVVCGKDFTSEMYSKLESQSVVHTISQITNRLLNGVDKGIQTQLII